MADWWQGFQAEADAVDRAIEREHQAAVDDGQPWPPERKPEAGHEEPDAATPRREPQLEQSRQGIRRSQTDPEPDTSEPETPTPEATEPGLADDGRATRLDELQARSDEAARRIDTQRAELGASSERATRIQREIQAEPEAGRQGTPYDMEMEL
jgi:flagellin-like hook-associated protein FlgL